MSKASSGGLLFKHLLLLIKCSRLLDMKGDINLEVNVSRGVSISVYKREYVLQ